MEYSVLLKVKITSSVRDKGQETLVGYDNKDKY